MASNKLNADTRNIEDAGEKTDNGLYITSSNILTTIVDANATHSRHVGMKGRHRRDGATDNGEGGEGAERNNQTIKRGKETSQEAAAMQQRNT